MMISEHYSHAANVTTVVCALLTTVGSQHVPYSLLIQEIAVQWFAG